jgi:hypothetical protein
MDLSPLRDLANRWREEADRYERDGVPGHAALLRRVADDFTQAFDRWFLQELTLEQAAAELGRSYDTVQRKIRSGELPNAGRKGRPLVRRCDLHSLENGAAGPRRLRDEIVAEELMMR